MSTNPSPVLAAALSLIFPGLGQIYAGAVRRGVAWALPTLALILLALVAVITKFSFTSLVTSEGTLAVIALEFAFLFYHLAAMLDAYSIAQRLRRGRGLATGGTAAGVLIGLLVIAVLLHGYPLWISIEGNSILTAIAPPGGRPGVLPSFSDVPTQPPMTFGPTSTPSAGTTATPTNTGEQTPTPTTGTSPSTAPKSFPPLQYPNSDIWQNVSQKDRLNVLLIGSDAGPGRHGGRTDTMIVLSVQPSTGRAAMFGFPRNMTSVPIEDVSGNNQFDRVWTDPDFPGNGDPTQSLLTNLWQNAYDHAGNYFTPPDACDSSLTGDALASCQGDARAFRATSGAIQNLAGVPIHGIISVNLTAFRQLVDAVGGVWIDVPDPVYDDQYPIGAGDTQSPRIINIPAGCNWFNGVYALAYARSRHQDSDYQRMKRQQLVLQAVRRQFDPVGMLPRVGDLLAVAADNLWTTFDRDVDIPILAQIAQRVNADQIDNNRITPGQNFPTNLTASEIKMIQSSVQHEFDQSGPGASPTPAPAGPKCPAPGQTPGPTFDTNPSPKPK